MLALPYTRSFHGDSISETPEGMIWVPCLGPADKGRGFKKVEWVSREIYMAVTWRLGLYLVNDNYINKSNKSASVIEAGSLGSCMPG